MAEPTKPGEVPNSHDGLGRLLETQKARGKDEPIKLPLCTFETVVSGEQIKSMNDEYLEQ
jgi:hypothetical protein